MRSVPFLTEVDSRAAVKGSRDPLGVQSIWTRFGRHVVGNLTTVSNSVCDFTTLLLGYYFVEHVADEVGPGSELATFLKWEQLAAYARGEVNGDWAFRGTERVRKALTESPRVTLSDERAWQILGNQKIYGLWGLYTMPARSSGLLDDGAPPRLTAAAREFVERHYLKLLAEEGFQDDRSIVQLLTPPQARLNIRGNHASLLRAVARLLPRRPRAREREFYRTHLLYGGPDDKTQGRQRQLASLLERTLSKEDFKWSPATVAALAKEARAQGEDWHPLAHRLERIRVCETLLAPMVSLFVYLLGFDGKPLEHVVQRLRTSWGAGLTSVDLEAVRELQPELNSLDQEGARWISIAEAATQGDYAVLLQHLCAQNQWVMSARGGAPWLEVRDERLHVRFRDEQGELPKKEKTPELWRFSYFLDSLRAVASVVRKN